MAKECYAAAKALSKEYWSLKNYTLVVEKKRKGLIQQIRKQNNTGGPLALFSANVFNSYPVSEQDKSLIEDYLEAKEKIYIVEKGIAQMEDGEWKEIAKDQIIAGMKSRDVMKKHSITSSKRDRAIREAVLQIAEWLAIMYDWKSKNSPEGGQINDP